VLTLILLHFAGACCAPLLVRWLGSRAFLALALIPAAALAWAAGQYGGVAGGAAPAERWRWMPALGVELSFRCDALALLMAALVAGVGMLVLVYCAGYFSRPAFSLGQFAGTLTAFAGAMLGLVLADDLIVLYVLWELTSVLSFLLIGHVPERRPNRLAALQALLVTVAGGLAMLVGFVMLGETAGTYRLSALLADPPPTGASTSVALVLILAGALSKSAVWPFSFWLPGAMAAPTPVSAYLHAAAMVKAGVYLIARLAPAFAHDASWQTTVLVLGTATMLLGGWRALRETDLKRLLAHGTVSQLGLLTVLTGAGTRATALAGIAMLLAHALFKAPLFLVVGIIDHATGTRRTDRLSGLGRSMPAVCAVAVTAAASMAALPPLLGFAAKEAAFTALLDSGHGPVPYPVQVAVTAAVAVGSALTVAYTLQFLWGAFAVKPAAGRINDPTPLPPGTNFLLTVPPAVCATAGAALGPAVFVLGPLTGRYARTFPASGAPPALALWHGLNTALLLSAAAWLAGGALFLAARPLKNLGERLAVPEGRHVFARLLAALERTALEVTGSVQRGSLPVYLGTVLAVLIAAQSTAMALAPPWQHTGDVRWFDSLPQLGVALIVCVVAALCLTARQRVTAAVLAGVTGYGTAVLYVLHGAPDLALTQFAVETVSLVVLVLVLRRLPMHFPDERRTSRLRRVTRLITGLAAGTFAAVMTYAAGTAREQDPTGPELTAATARDGLKNVVSTTLVDLRSWDTLGESAVLGAAAVGVTSLVFLRRRTGTPAGARPAAAPVYVRAGQRPEPRGHPAPVWPLSAEHRGSTPHGGGVPRRTWLTASGTLDPERRSVIFEVLARLVFHPIVVLSLYLLFCAENLPGGGFSAGLVAGLALAVRYLAGGRYELDAAAPVDAGFLLGIGLTTMTATGLAGLVLRGSVLHAGTYQGELPLIEKFHAASPVLFDTGVYLLVLGVVLDVLRSLGSEIDRRVERALREESAGHPQGQPSGEGGR
jgi:multicomponent Na+:H+ antiporter subunit A